MKIEVLRPLHIRRAGGDLHLKPGCPVELADEEATRLLAKSDAVRRVVPQEGAHLPNGGTEPATGFKQPCPYQADEVVIEPAVKPDGFPLRPIYWEGADGSILGPASVLFFDRDGLIVEYGGDWQWINADQLRSKQQWAGRKIDP